MGLSGRLLGTEETSFLRGLDVQLVLLVSVVSSMSAVASPALPAMGGAFDVTPAQLGLVFTAYTLPGVFILPLIGLLGDVKGRRAAVVPGLLLFGVAGFAVGLVSDFRLVLALRVLQGVGYAAFNVLTVAIIGDLLDGPAESAAQGVRATLNKVAGFAGPVLAGVLAGIAWNYPFFLYGIAVPVGLLFYLRFGVGDSDAALGGHRRPVAHYLRETAGLASDPFVATVLAGGFFRMFLKYALYAFIALAVVDGYGGTASYAGFLLGLYSIVGAMVSSQSARVTGTLGFPAALAVGFLVAASAFVAFPLAGGLAPLTVLVVVHGIGEGIINPVHKSLLTRSADRDLRASVVSLNGVTQSIGRTVTPVVLTPMLVVGGRAAYDLLFAVAGGVVLVATAAAAITFR